MEPLKPFEPIKPFEPLKPFEPPKSFELTKIADDILSKKPSEQSNGIRSEENKFSSGKENTDETKLNGNEVVAESNNSGLMGNGNGELPEGYTPVVALEPLKPDEWASKEEKPKEFSSKVEIEEGKVKNALKEIISEIDTFAEKDRELKEVEVNGHSYQDNEKVL